MNDYEKSLYLKVKEKYNWNESEPTNFMYEINWQGVYWYKSWGDGNKIPYHREDGPARMWSNDFVEYWYNGVYYKDINTFEEFCIKRILE